MIWFILILISFIVYEIKDELFEFTDFGEKMIFIFFDLMAAFVVAIILTFTCGIFIPESQKELYIVQEQNIYSLKDNLGIEGKFVLGCGNIESELKYYFMIKEDFGYKVENASMDETNISEVDTVPRYIIYGKQYKNKFLCLIAIDSFEKNVLEVPKGTIKIDYKVDLE